ncbi:YdgA family protein [Marinobacter daepoensis]|uniref:YdgA family protein n=1 Tax=Marinobacter daepoensis TaxID=262077 RepID=A0ABS3BG20_9GAMM|nr:DUF945 family protein [Marinobacter daepoensis]MBN7770260.1 YdgA family protein [Marinobacter daepoensis]MBY6079706.1 YdgA family protein [Marinobacter daepoensis]
MKPKHWTLAGLAVLVAAGGAPWGVGYVTEQHWREATLEVNRAQPFLNFQTDEYRRGVLGSEVSATVTLIDPETGDSRSVAVDIQISHGITGSLMDFRPRDGWQPQGADWFPESEPVLTLETRLWGSATLELDAPVMRIEGPDESSFIQSSGGLVRVDVGRLGEEAELLVVWPAVRVHGPALDVTVDDFHVEQSMEWLVGDIWTGSGVMAVDTMTLQAPESSPVTLKGLSLESLSETDDGGQRLDSRVTLSLESAALPDEMFGPHRLEVALEGLDVASWNTFSRALTDLQSLAINEYDDPAAAFEQQMAVVQRFNGAVHGLAAQGFSAGVRELSLETPEGEVSGSLMVSHPELSGDQRDTMLMVMQALKGSVDFSMPMTLAENYPAVRMQVAPLLKQGLLVQEGERLVMEGRMEDLVLTVNEVQIPLPPLL